MADATAAFVGKIPENYERYLASLFFEGYADDLVARLPVHDGMRILEVACGTGIVTRRLVARLAGRGSVMATDLNEAMFAHARNRLPGPGDAPGFYTVPFSCHDTAVLESLLATAGFEAIRIERLALEGTSPSAADAAVGLIEGNPIFGEIMRRRPAALDDIKAAVAASLARELGDRPLRAPLRAVVATARRP